MGTLFYVPNTMAIKVLINELGQHLIADVSQVTNKETEELVAYWVKNPRLVSYSSEEGQTAISLLETCPISCETEYAIAAHHIVSILEPAADVTKGYLERTAPNEEPAGPQIETVLHEKAPETPDEETGLLPKPERPAN